MMMMAIPAILSAIGGLTGQKAQQGSTYSKGQRSTIDSILDQIRGGGGAPDINQNPQFQQSNEWLQSLFNDPAFFEKFENPAMRQFNEQIVPSIANRFASMGSGGALNSSGFRNQMAREGGNLATNLAAQRGQMQQNAIPQLQQNSQMPFQNIMQMLQQSLQPTMNQYTPASPGFGGNIGASMFGGLAQGFGQNMGSQMANLFPGQSP